jgi:hypothetical protein
LHPYVTEIRGNSPVSDVRLMQNKVLYDVEKVGIQYAWIFPHGDHASIGSVYFPRFGQKGEERRRTIEKFFKDRGIDLGYAKKRAAPMNIAYNYFKRRNVYLIRDSASFLNVAYWRGDNGEIIGDMDLLIASICLSHNERVNPFLFLNFWYLFISSSPRSLHPSPQISAL